MEFLLIVIFCLCILILAYRTERESYKKKYDDLLASVEKLNKKDIDYIKVSKSNDGESDYTEIKFDSTQEPADAYY